MAHEWKGKVLVDDSIVGPALFWRKYLFPSVTIGFSYGWVPAMGTLPKAGWS
jgi:hypothetical protein